MSRQKDNDKLDELIFGAINTEEPQFDAEKWKQKFPDEYQALVSRSDKSASSRKPDIWRVIFGKSITRLAAAAAIIVVIGLFLSRNPQNPNGLAVKPPPVVQSPANIISMVSMRMAYQRGGIDALDQQFRDTLDVFGPRSSSVSIQELL